MLGQVAQQLQFAFLWSKPDGVCGLHGVLSVWAERRGASGLPCRERRVSCQGWGVASSASKSASDPVGEGLRQCTPLELIVGIAVV
jgi:hypothetical protein